MRVGFGPEYEFCNVSTEDETAKVTVSANRRNNGAQNLILSFEQDQVYIHVEGGTIIILPQGLSPQQLVGDGGENFVKLREVVKEAAIRLYGI